MNEGRIGNLLRQAVSRFGISLNSYSILTEAASGYFAVTSLLAAMGGSKKVFAMVRDSKYGRAEEIALNTLTLAEKFGVKDRIEILFSRNDVRIAQADIVTNLGFVRPINAELIGKLKNNVSISLMWETWEFRPQDLDLALCHSLGIPVLGTNEHHPDLKIFSYIGHVVLKLLYGLEIEVFKSNVVIVGSGEFAEEARNTLTKAGAIPELIDVGDLSTALGKKLIQGADALVLLEHHDRRLLIGEEGLISAKEVYELNTSLVIAHVCGGANQRDLESAGLRFLPRDIAPAGYMSVSTTYVGPRPVIELHAAGIKVGQVMAEAVAKGLSGINAEKWALENCEYAQGFKDRH